MKKEWINPELNQVGVEVTEKVEPIISSSFAVKPLFSWYCPCCTQDSGHIFETDNLAKEDFHNNHLPNCSKYNAETDSCVIS